MKTRKKKWEYTEKDKLYLEKIPTLSQEDLDFCRERIEKIIALQRKNKK